MSTWKSLQHEIMECEALINEQVESGLDRVQLTKANCASIVVKVSYCADLDVQESTQVNKTTNAVKWTVGHRENWSRL